jgi:transcriptional regulator with XRE-family HTH domain
MKKKGGDLKMKQVELARAVGVSESHLSLILSGRRRPSYQAAKRMELVTGIPIIEWMEAPPLTLRRDLANTPGKGGHNV